jgi:hypothetical protein
MHSKTRRKDFTPARTKLSLACVWAVAFILGMTADIRLQDAAVILFDGNLGHAIQDLAGVRVPAALQSPSAA